MPTTTAGQIMRGAASLMNDTARAAYPYTIQLPYLTMALQDLRKLLELNNSPVTNEATPTVINVPAGTTFIRFTGGPPTLPADLVEIQQIWESIEGQEKYTPMTRREFIPLYLEGVTTSGFGIFAWKDNEIQLPESSTDNDLKLDYVKTLFTVITDENSIIGVINSDSYLQYRTAALLAEFVGENPTRAMSLNLQAKEAFDILIAIDNKGRQAISTRRRPFRSAWKNRGFG